MSKQKRRGRPQSAEPGNAVCTWVSQRELDHLVRLAAKSEEKSVSAVIRKALRETVLREAV